MNAPADMIAPRRKYWVSVGLLFAAFAARALIPEYSVMNDMVKINAVAPDNPIIYDNDFWTDVPDAAYLWGKGESRRGKPCRERTHAMHFWLGKEIRARTQAADERGSKPFAACA